MDDRESDNQLEDESSRMWRHIKLPPNVEVRDEVVSIRFRYKGHRHRELKLPASEKNIRDAYKTLVAVERDIQFGAFLYSKYFPDSDWCVRYGESKPTGRLFETAAQEYLEKLAPINLDASTLRKYRQTIAGVWIPLLGNQCVTEITREVVTDLIETLGMTRDDEENFLYVAKTIKNYVTPLRNVFDREADRVHTIKSNPCDGIKIMKLLPKEVRLSKRAGPKPYTASERAAIYLHATYQTIANQIEFWCGTGVRSQEVIAIKWIDLDESDSTIHICRSVDDAGKLRDYTKTEGSTRKVRLDAGVTDVLSALKRQRAITGDNKDGFIFINPIIGERWNKPGTIANSQWDTLLKHAEVAYRGPNQCRHTYACERITRGDNAWDIAAQMGHENPEMLYRHYGKLMEQKQPEVAKQFKAKLRLVA